MKRTVPSPAAASLLTGLGRGMPERYVSACFDCRIVIPGDGRERPWIACPQCSLALPWLLRQPIAPWVKIPTIGQLERASREQARQP